ncbi:MAG TPA: DUF4838 domain-containing protein, partial [Pirellulales bacterium]|nr:DUF4838 domain-containing protein [Pirellulales bacterium]
ELQHYIRAMTIAEGAPQGATLPIVPLDEPTEVDRNAILVGRPATNAAIAKLVERERIDLDQLGSDGYVIKTCTGAAGPTLLLAGANDRGTLFAAYHLLELCGVRFFGYRDRGGEIVPQLDSLQIEPLDLCEKPTFRYRFVSDNNFDAADKPKLVNVADWAAKNRCNAFMLTLSRPGESWEQLGLDEVRKRGLLIAGPGHILAQLTPAGSYFATHPEYFPLLKGHRAPVDSPAWGGAASFCWSNPEAMRIVVANAVRYLERTPFIDLFAVYPPDGPQQGVQCRCDDCAKRTMSDWYLTLINAIAREATARGLRPKFVWIAYNECGVPPREVTPIGDGADFVLLWCNDIRTFDASMDAEANRHAARYLQWKPRLKNIKTAGARDPGDTDLAAWHRWQGWAKYLRAANYRGEVVVLDYYNQHVGKSLRVPMLSYCQSGPWPDGLMQRDFRFYARQGIAGWQNCTDYYNDHPNPYWNRLAAQLLWNHNSDLSAIDDDFYGRYYGIAGRSMQAYFAALWRELSVQTASQADVERVERLEPLLQAAAEIVGSNNTLLAARIKTAREFHKRCLAIKLDFTRQYQPDGTPNDGK